MEFASDIPAHTRARIFYAFQVFAAIYNHSISASPGSDCSLRCFYGWTPPPGGDSGTLHIPALYNDKAETNAAMQKHRYAGENLYLACGLDHDRPDWLGEIFLWLSSSHEQNITARDDVGRIPYSETVFCREGISPRKPYAAFLMAWLENVLSNGAAAEERLPKAPSPVADANHLVLSSHDIDFYFIDRGSAMLRTLKNLAIAVHLYRSSSFFFDNLRMLALLCVGKPAGDYLPALADAAAQHHFRSTIFVVARHSHRRDPNYTLEQLAPHLAVARKEDFSLGVHGSYRSVIEDATLPAETQDLGRYAGQQVLGGRQHWLRFDNHRELFSQIEQSGLQADSTLGFPDMVGFRNGACFAFPPYNFAKEQAHNLLEIPLVLMDGNLAAASRALRVAPQQLADEVLAESRKIGWGGISILWHNPMESLSVPAEINQVFWNCAKQQTRLNEKWVSLDQFLRMSVDRYQQAGLLNGVRVSDSLIPSGLEQIAPRTSQQRS